MQERKENKEMKEESTYKKRGIHKINYIEIPKRYFEIGQAVTVPNMEKGQRRNGKIIKEYDNFIRVKIITQNTSYSECFKREDIRI